jgi:hypothetical protein
MGCVLEIAIRDHLVKIGKERIIGLVGAVRVGLEVCD